MLYLLNHCNFVFNDSDGLLKEAFILKKFCFILRNETESVETVNAKVNLLVCNQTENIVSVFNQKFVLLSEAKFETNLYGNGKA